MNTAEKKNWSEANQHYLMTAINLLREELETYHNSAREGEKSKEATGNEAAPISPSPDQDALAKAAWEINGVSALESLVASFGLSDFERKILLLCAGAELDANFSALIATLQGNPSLVHPSFGLAMAAFAGAHWSALSPRSPLRYWRLIECSNGETLAKSPLRIDEHVLQYMAGIHYLDEKLEEIVRPEMPHDFLIPSHANLAHTIQASWTSKNGTGIPPLIHLRGGNSADKPAIAAFTCEGMGIRLYTLAASSLPGSSREIKEWTHMWNREAALHSLALFVDASQVDAHDKQRVQLLHNFLENIEGMLFLDTSQWQPALRRRIAEYTIDKPAVDEQMLLWKKHLGEDRTGLDEQLETVVSHFNLSAKTIEAASLGVPAALPEKSEGAAFTQILWKACCVHTRPGVDELAQRIEPASRWDDLVLPEAQKMTLREVAVQARHRKKVYHDWGFAGKGSRGLGISALFSGESGTGKTMAAEVLANELQLDLYRIDLSQVVNKYIGETEKNLKRIFDAAEEGGAILLFDEADALFGKRSDVKDSHDRYSNIEVSYLLQRMEAYSGLAILTTNLKSAIDRSFLRRIRFVVQFPYPDAVHRAEIWRRIFPAGTPLEGLDIEKLSRLTVPGGNIRNIAINAAFLAAGDGAPVQMRHIARAVKSEYGKIEKAMSSAETGGW